MARLLPESSTRSAAMSVQAERPVSSNGRPPEGGVPANGLLRIAIVTEVYSEGMGYVENCLPASLAALGHEVHVVTSTFRGFGNLPEYEITYQAFHGPRSAEAGRVSVNGYDVHRLPAWLVSGYVKLKGLGKTLRRLSPDVVLSLEVASLDTWELAVLKPFTGFELFCASHHHMSVVRPFLKTSEGHVLRKVLYRLTRTLRTHLASRAVSRCYASAPDCAEVATRFFGVPSEKVHVQSLGTDTALFRPAASDSEQTQRCTLRRALGYADDDVVCLYSGRFSKDKNPLLLAEALQHLGDERTRFRGLFIGDGEQKAEIASYESTTILPFMKYTQLADYYRAADIAVWPRQESMSMLDAASSGLPIVVSHTMGEMERVHGNGLMFEEDDVPSLVAALRSLADARRRQALGAAGREKMLRAFSWMGYARNIEADFHAAVRSRKVTVPGSSMFARTRAILFGRQLGAASSGA